LVGGEKSLVVGRWSLDFFIHHIICYIFLSTHLTEVE
jgi:hypothetical protein